VLKNVFDAVMGVFGGDGGLDAAHGVFVQSSVSEADDGAERDWSRDQSAAAPESSTLSSSATAAAAPSPPPDIVCAPVPGKIGGDGALDAGSAGNPSGTTTPARRPRSSFVSRRIK
jgi:hypothetical protein